MFKTGQKKGQDWWDWLQICDTSGFIENNARNLVIFNILSCSFISIDFRALSFLGIKIFFSSFLFFDSTVQENDREFNLYRLI